MIDLTGVTHHPAITEIVDVLCNKTQNSDRSFFNVEVAYFLGKMASNMRATIVTKDRGDLPVNIYACALATSGFGKGHSISIMEEEFMNAFERRFKEETFPLLAEKNLVSIATDRYIRKNTSYDEEHEKADKEFNSAGELMYTFDSGTVPALKQLRHKLLMANCGAINYQVDEIGSNLIDNTDMLVAFLELYDQGKIKDKLVKNTADNKRVEPITGKTPANMLLFGTPSKLFDGSKTEESFYSFLETGYARRCLFGSAMSEEDKAKVRPDASQLYYNLINPANSQSVVKWSTNFYDLANPNMFEWRMDVEDSVGITLLEYKLSCEARALDLPNHEEIRKAELNHRYFKVLKLAGAYSFVDHSTVVTLNNLLSAILLVEESGECFEKLLNREKTYMKLANYIAESKTELTHADLTEALPFYRSGVSARNELMTMAKAWGYKQHILIKTRYIDGIEMFMGETLEETDLDNIIVSYSNDFAYNYQNVTASFENMTDLAVMENTHWANHHFTMGHRCEENVINKFNMIVVDVDGGVNLETAKDLLSDYEFITYTTKRHTEENNRFRMLFPTNYVLSLDKEEYAKFMLSFLAWLPFTVDESANQRSRKWLSFDGEVFHNKGDQIDIIPFIPDTTKNEQFKDSLSKIESFDNLERWYATKIAVGNRNNVILRYAMQLADSGLELQVVIDKVNDFNAKISNSLSKDELEKTVLASVAKKYIAR